MTAFIAAFVLVTVAEMADKTQLLTLSLACRYPARMVLIGVSLAIAILNLVAVVIGAVAGRFIPVSAVQIGAGVLFVAFGLWSLLAKDKPEKAEECEVRSDKHVDPGRDWSFPSGRDRRQDPTGHHLSRGTFRGEPPQLGRSVGRGDT